MSSLKNIKKDALLKACETFKINCKSSDKKLTLYKKIVEKSQKILSTKKMSVSNQKGGMKIDIKSCENSDFTFKNQLNVGDDQVGIYVTCDKNNSCDYIAKIKLSSEYYERDLKYFNMLKDENVTPKFYGNWECKIDGENYSVIILEKMDGDLFDLIKREKPTVGTLAGWLNIIYEKLKKLEKYNLLHNDLKTKNVLYKKINESYDFFLTDFEWSTDFKEEVGGKSGVIFYDSWEFPNEFHKNYDMVCLLLSVVLHSKLVNVNYTFTEITDKMGIKISIGEFQNNLTRNAIIIMGYEFEKIENFSLLTRKIVNNKHYLEDFLENYDPKKIDKDTYEKQVELFFEAYEHSLNDRRKGDILEKMSILIHKNINLLFYKNTMDGICNRIRDIGTVDIYRFLKDLYKDNFGVICTILDDPVTKKSYKINF